MDGLCDLITFSLGSSKSGKTCFNSTLMYVYQNDPHAPFLVFGTAGSSIGTADMNIWRRNTPHALRDPTRPGYLTVYDVRGRAIQRKSLMPIEPYQLLLSQVDVFREKVKREQPDVQGRLEDMFPHLILIVENAQAYMSDLLTDAELRRKCVIQFRDLVQKLTSTAFPYLVNVVFTHADMVDVTFRDQFLDLRAKEIGLDRTQLYLVTNLNHASPEEAERTTKSLTRLLHSAVTQRKQHHIQPIVCWNTSEQGLFLYQAKYYYRRSKDPVETDKPIIKTLREHCKFDTLNFLVDRDNIPEAPFFRHTELSVTYSYKGWPDHCVVSYGQTLRLPRLDEINRARLNFWNENFVEVPDPRRFLT